MGREMERNGEDLGEGEAVIRIYYIFKSLFSVKKKEKQKFLKVASVFAATLQL